MMVELYVRAKITEIPSYPIHICICVYSIIDIYIRESDSYLKLFKIPYRLNRSSYIIIIIMLLENGQQFLINTFPLRIIYFRINVIVALEHSN